MKVLHCIHSLAGGGAERQLCQMLAMSSSCGIDMRVFCVNDDYVEGSVPSDRVIKISDKKKYPFELINEIGRAVDGFQPDLVHCWLPVPVILPAMIVAKWRSLPVLASYRVSKKFRSVYEWIEYFAYRYMADTIVSNNPPEQSNAAYRRLFASKRGVYIPNSVSVDLESHRDIQSSDPEEPFKILFVGRIADEQKNWRNLLAAVSQIERDKNFRLQICGSGDEDEQLKTEVYKLGLGERVDILGYCSDVYAVVRRSDVLVLPSWYEGMPNVVVEAMALGLPVIVSRVPAHTLLFGDHSGVTYIDPADPSSITNALGSFMDGEVDLKCLVETAYEFAKTLSPEKLLQRYQSLYERVVDDFDKKRKA